MRTYNQLTQTERCQIFAMREANKNPTDFLKKDIITSKVILHETDCQMPLLVFIGWKRNSFPDYHFARPLDRTIKVN